ncbi:transcriptional regulator, TetR family [Cellulomonas flavigena DSM 20109]|uniref:Transcriptional regulator, TetR family n=1 Tax=Cellulomonas flavigena (strain ATCC 482 / DSM 20109 / BCRC 11376 / JCM 18109 / NBRC 3775 / NCIMB 8073 / NRS 134) TaxID=446466 RepID=D5UFN1_CELFN|nr:TetR/AcrR family transcriptional regulator [Cellulomonas flavigena]ADG72990.1 transcriptional regulator, TetR family [Cellulomonas flavigena DSM 20109]
MNLPEGGGHRSVDERRAQLLDAALAVLREQGLAGLTTRAVTARAGAPHGIFHYAFGSKAALVRALIERELRGATDAWAPALATDDLEAALRHALRAQLDLVRADPAHQAAMFELIRAARDDGDVSTVAFERQRYHAAITERLTTWSQRSGAVWAGSAEQVAALILSATDGVIQAWVTDHDDTLAEASIDLLARAITSLASPA